MAEGLSGFKVALFGRMRGLFAWPVIQIGINPSGLPTPVVVSSSGGITTSTVGAKNLSTAQVTTSTSASTLAIARPTRTGILISNLDASITIYVGPATVSSSNGFPLLAGQSCPFTWVGLIQVISASGTPVVAVADEYN